MSADFTTLSKTAVALSGVLEPYASSSMGSASQGRRVASWLGSVTVMLRSAGFAVVEHYGWYGPSVLVVSDTLGGARNVPADTVRRIVEMND